MKPIIIMRRSGLKVYVKKHPFPNYRVICGREVGNGGRSMGVRIVQFYLISLNFKSWLPTIPRNGRKSLWWVVGGWVLATHFSV